MSKNSKLKGDASIPMKQGDTLECAVCLQTCVHPAQLPCGHIFCYLCVKGFANQNKRCAMCRQEIPRDFIEQPRLLYPYCSCIENGETFDGDFKWYYEGRNGWWLYDERTSKELEISYKKGEKNVEILIAGFLYIIDFENMLQLRRNDPSRRRQIKRDHASQPIKGVAGLRTEPSIPTTSDPTKVNSNTCPFLEASNSTQSASNNAGATSQNQENIRGSPAPQNPRNIGDPASQNQRTAVVPCPHIALLESYSAQEGPGTSENIVRAVVEQLANLRLAEEPGYNGSDESSN